jgi:hypothetical protein
MFQKDSFSYSKIKWIKTKNKNAKKIINNYILKKNKKHKILLYQHGGLELNSKNFKIKINKKYKLLKRWDYVHVNRHDQKINPKNIQNSLSTLSWLSKQKVKVLKPEKFLNKKKLIYVNNSYWSIFPFYEGSHYNGNNVDFKNITKIIAKTSQLLLRYPMKYKINKKIFKGFDDTKKIIKIMSKKSKNWKKYFGKKNSNILKLYWPKIVEIHNYLEKTKVKKKYLAPVHTDMHPHNLLVNKNHILILDPDSIMVAPAGEALAYAGLKICRQHIVKNGLQKSAAKIGSKYINIVNKHYSLGKKFSKDYYYLSLSYVLERLVNIFRLNVFKKNKQWNNFLLMQLKHIDEAEKIFKSKS